ncbi:MAG: hypothetical protein FJ128_14175 [Deltaproteobacteria bacterium]|nr:hypothetical protein [Deltaproteobacteria bacterium]
MRLVVSVDVEEEGLFSGQYPRQAAGVRNVARLSRLAFISQEFGVPLTLLATYPVAVHPEAAAVLREFREQHGAEIGAHLHPWNTPPFLELGEPEPAPPERLPLEVLRDKITSLAAAIHAAVGERPRSFRMGRFELGPKALSLLPELGFVADGSMAPLRAVAGGPDHFLSPADPFILRPQGEAGPALVEAPLTVVPLLAGTPRLWAGLCSLLPPAWGERLRGGFRFAAAVGTQPTMFSLTAMRLAARLHRRRGGRVIHLFLHSSELLPGASPQFPTEQAVEGLIGKIRSFLAWLRKTSPCRGVTLSALAREMLEG